VKAYVAFPIVTGDKTGTTYEYHPYTIETWWGTDDSGRTVQTADRTTKDESYGPGDFPSDVSTKDFPTDPAELKQFLIDRSSPGGASPEPMFPTPPGGGSHDGQLWDVVSTIIDDPNMTPSVRAAVLEMAANLQSSQVDLTATDPGGRPAYRISVTQGGTLKELFVDPSTHELLAERNVRDGHLLWLYVEEAAGVADSTSAAPSQSSVPPPVTQPHVGIGGAGSG
jgi:hypothetical protein